MTAGQTAMPPSSPLLSAEERLREAALALAAVVPGLALGGLLAQPLRHRRGWLWAAAGLGCTLALLLFRVGWYQPAWEWNWLIGQIGLGQRGAHPGNHGVAGALLVESLWGPLWAAVIPGSGGAANLLLQVRRSRWLWRLRAQSMQHPPGFVRLGIDPVTGRPLDLSIEDDLMKGGAIYGVTGSGKSTLLRVLVEGALASGAAVTVVDGKGPALRPDMEAAALHRRVPFYLLDPSDPRTFRYDPLDGTPARVTNKLMAGLVPQASGDAAIYKMLAMAACSPLIGALQRVGRSNLRELERVLGDPGALAQLAREDGSDGLRELAAKAGRDRLLQSALSGMSGRLGALSSGFFRPLLDGPAPAYSWSLTDRKSVTLLSVPSLEAVADSALMARVFLSDVAQLVARRLADPKKADLSPLLLICDELTALSQSDPEIEQRLVGLLLQARGARVSVIAAGQALPEDPLARQAVVGSGLLVSLRLTARDSEAMSAEFGTKETTTVTHQIEQGQLSGSGTASLSHSYRVHPQDLRTLKVGEAILMVPPHQPKRLTIARDESPIPSTQALLWRRFLVALLRR